MSIFLSLLIVHLLADFFLQKDEWINSKIKYKIKSIGLLKHVLVHLALNAILLFVLLDGMSTAYFIALFSIVLSHYAIDIWKTYQVFSIRAFLIDQVAHLIILAVVSAWLNGTTLEHATNSIKAFLSIDILVIFAALIFISKPLSFIIYLSLSPYTQSFEKNEKQKGLSRAGEFIGILERYLVLILVLAGQYTGVGFLLAAKSVFRFGDMREQKDRKLTEYIMLGTLMSIASALTVGLLVSWLIDS
ncbi:DUF3307 domain-containing protein [Agaribacter flavus]|uniref:DUF3307 domain-containing protein n=1 Tax=Agaribacter flavus TaxID=1902781 RepID=A0ABV7FT97_9ALTE